MRRSLFLVILAVSIVLGGRVASADGPARPVPARPAGECTTAATWAKLVETRSRGVRIAVLADIVGFEARDLVAQVNETPPETHMAADHVLVLGARSIDTDAPAPYVLIAFFNHGCLVTAGRANPEAVSQLLSGSSI